jgi:hypothetical protein
VRILTAIAVAFLYFTGRISGTVGIILAVIAVVLLLTSFAGRCPGYLPFRFSTRKERPTSSPG